MELKIIPLSKVKIPTTRQRQTFLEENRDALAYSIKTNGLFHAPVITTDFQLIAGFCRYTALSYLAEHQQTFSYNGEEIPLGFLPVVLTHKTDEADLYEIELEENLRRVNLSLIEQAQAITTLHEFRKKQNPEQSNLKTAEELTFLRPGSSVSGNERKVSNSLLISQFADDEEVANARTMGAAVRIAKKKLEQSFMTSLGSLSENSADLTIVNTRMVSYLPSIADHSFAGIITDPPYGINADEFGSASFLNTSHFYEDSAENAVDLIQILAKHSYRICKPQAHLYLFCDILKFEQLSNLFLEANWAVWPRPLIWFKGPTAHASRPDAGPKFTYEAILFATKGEKKVTKTGLDVLSYSSVHGTKKLHPAEKPTDLLRELISWSFQPGSTIFDPFLGSGSLLVAAKEMKCKALGLEINPDMADLAKARVANG